MKWTSRTLLPVSSITIISTVILWVSLTYAKVQENSRDIINFKLDNREIINKLDSISAKLNRIEGYLEYQKEKELTRKAKQ